MNVCSEFHGNLFNILLKATNVDLIMERDEKSEDQSQKPSSPGDHEDLYKPLSQSTQHVETFRSGPKWWTNQQTETAAVQSLFYAG